MREPQGTPLPTSISIPKQGAHQLLDSGVSERAPGHSAGSILASSLESTLKSLTPRKLGKAMPTVVLSSPWAHGFSEQFCELKFMVSSIHNSLRSAKPSNQLTRTDKTLLSSGASLVSFHKPNSLK